MNNNTLDSLKQMDMGGIRSFYEEPQAVRDASAGLDGDRVHIQTVTKRQLVSTMQRASALTTLPRLPAVGETWHIACAGNWSSFDLVPTAMSLTGSAISHLCIATLGFSKANGEELLGLLDKGAVGRLSMLVSCYFKSHESTLTGWLGQELLQRGQRFASVRNHAKVIGMQFQTGEHIVIESSANLRSCRNIEQFCVSNDAALFNFHTGWMHDILLKGNQR